jgi:hypothetical protein
MVARAQFLDVNRNSNPLVFLEYGPKNQEMTKGALCWYEMIVSLGLQIDETWTLFFCGVK